MTFESLLYVFLKIKENVFTVWIHSILIIISIHEVGFAWVFRIHESETQPLNLFHEIVIPGRVKEWEITKWRTCNTISLKIQIIRKWYLVLEPYLHRKYEQYALDWNFSVGIKIFTLFASSPFKSSVFIDWVTHY